MARQHLDDNAKDRAETTNDFNEKKTTLTEGLAATKKAVEIIREHVKNHGGDIEAADQIQHEVATTVQVAAPSGFLQRKPRRRARVLHLLNTAASVTHSRAMMGLVRELSSGPETKPFLQKAVDLVQKMIQRLRDEQREEDDKKAWCDDNIARTERSIDTLNVSHEEYSSAVSEHSSNQDTLDGEISRAKSNVNEAQRVLESNDESAAMQKKECDRNLKEHKAALDAVDRARYEVRKQIEPKDDADASQGADIMNAIDTAVDDLKKTQAVTMAQCSESKDKAANKERRNKVILAENEQRVTTKTDAHARETEKLNTATKKKAATQKELGLAQQYREELRPACEDGESDYQTRKQARASEREALEQVIPILECDIHDDDQDEACAEF